MKRLVIPIVLSLVFAAVITPRVAAAQIQPNAPNMPNTVRAERPVVLNRADRVNAFYQRADSLITTMANNVPADDLSRGGYFDVVAKLYRNQDLDWCVARLDSLMAAPAGDMFWMYPFITVMYVGQDKLPEATRARMRDLWRTYTPYRGDTENHWAMYYTAMYLVTQMYPDEPADSWFNGKSSAENHAEAEEYLLSWIELTTTIGQGEYDSPDYFPFFMVPSTQLLAFSSDPAMRLRAEMLVDYLVADFQVDALEGIYTGAHSRVYPRQALETWFAGSAGYSWLLFGNTPRQDRGEAILLPIAGYEPSALMRGIALDRSRPYVHREKKRTRHRMRFSPGVRNAPVYKYSYMTADYAVGSSQGGLLQPIQQKTWGVTWAVDDPRGIHNTFFTLHPHSSTFELGMYFSGPLGFITEGVTRSKTTYDSPDKLTGGSPYEQVFQHEDAVIALYNIQEGTRWPHVSAFFSKDLTHREEDESGWIFAQGGNALLAVHPLAQYTWHTDETTAPPTILQSSNLKNGFVIQVAPSGSFTDFEAFKSAVRGLALEKTLEPVPSVHFTTLRGSELVATYGAAPTVNGRAVDYEAWKLFEGPYLNADVGSERLTLTWGSYRREVDFENLKIIDSVAPAKPITGTRSSG